MLIHWPMALKETSPVDEFPRDEQGNLIFSDVHYMETWRALEECVDENSTKSIGLSNFNIEQCQDVLNKCRIKPVCNQIEVHPYFQNDQLVEFCQNNGMIVVAYSPLGAVDLAQTREELPNILLDESLIRIGKKHNKTAAQVCLRWSLQRGCVPVVKSLQQDQIVENAQIFDFTLDDEDMQAIKSLNRNLRIFKMNE
jgi:diketogulonate reductase-like aldo/keto reductase